MTAPLFVTADETLLDELVRLAAAAGTTPEVAHDVPAALRAWSQAPLVLVGEDLAPELARVAPPRRDAVFVGLTAPVPGRVFQVALALGAESVAELPRSEGWLVERLTDVVDSGPARGLTIGVVGGSGGGRGAPGGGGPAQARGRARCPRWRAGAARRSWSTSTRGDRASTASSASTWWTASGGRRSATPP